MVPYADDAEGYGEQWRIIARICVDNKISDGYSRCAYEAFRAVQSCVCVMFF